MKPDCYKIEIMNGKESFGGVPFSDGGGEGTSEATRLMLQVCDGDYGEPMLEYALGCGADPLARDKNGSSAMHLATQRGSVEMILRMARAGAEIDALGPSGRTPLMAGARAGRADCVGHLLALGARVDVCDGNGATALSLCFLERGNPCAEVLLAAGADPSAVDGHGLSVLMHASRWRESVEMLVERGADVRVKNWDGKDAAALAREAGEPGVADWLKALARAQLERREIDDAADFSSGPVGVPRRAL